MPGLPRDITNFVIELKREGDEYRYTMVHKDVHDIVLRFKTTEKVAAKHMPSFIERLFRAWVHTYIAKTRRPLTGKQQKFYDKLLEFHKLEGRPPTYEEQCRFFDFKSRGTPFVYTRAIVARGWAWQDDHGKIWPVDLVAPEYLQPEKEKEK